MNFYWKVQGIMSYLPWVSREWENGSNSSYNCTPFLHSLLTKGKVSQSASPTYAKLYSKSLRIEYVKF